MITVAAPNPAIDRLLRVSRLEPGAIHRPEHPVALPGGKGLNVARVAHSLGAGVHVVGIAAGTTGRWIADALADLGIAAEWVWASGESRTCTSVSDAATHELTEFYEPGPSIEAAVWQNYVDLVRNVTPDSQWLAVSGSLPPGPTDEQLVSLLGAHRGLTAVDTSGEALKTATSWAATGLVKLNERETLELLYRNPSPSERPEASLPFLAAELFHYCGGATTVVVTGGVNGAAMVEPDGHMLRAQLPVLGRFPVGSGDAFLAGLLTARQGGGSWPEALRLATAAAAANAEVPGAGALDPGRASTLAAMIRVQEVTSHHG